MDRQWLARWCKGLDRSGRAALGIVVLTDIAERYCSTVLYEDPTDRRPLNLVCGLRQYASGDRRSPQEDQMTVVLAWLCGRDQDLAREIVKLFVGGDLAASTALASSTHVGVRSHVRLPRGEGWVYPDLSFDCHSAETGAALQVRLSGSSWNFDGPRDGLTIRP